MNVALRRHILRNVSSTLGPCRQREAAREGAPYLFPSVGGQGQGIGRASRVLLQRSTVDQDAPQFSAEGGSVVPISGPPAQQLIDVSFADYEVPVYQEAVEGVGFADRIAAARRQIEVMSIESGRGGQQSGTELLLSRGKRWSKAKKSKASTKKTKDLHLNPSGPSLPTVYVVTADEASELVGHINAYVQMDRDGMHEFAFTRNRVFTGPAYEEEDKEVKARRVWFEVREIFLATMERLVSLADLCEDTDRGSGASPGSGGGGVGGARSSHSANSTLEPRLRLSTDEGVRRLVQAMNLMNVAEEHARRVHYRQLWDDRPVEQYDAINYVPVLNVLLERLLRPEDLTPATATTTTTNQHKGKTAVTISPVSLPFDTALSLMLLCRRTHTTPIGVGRVWDALVEQAFLAVGDTTNSQSTSELKSATKTSRTPIAIRPTAAQLRSLLFNAPSDYALKLYPLLDSTLFPIEGLTVLDCVGLLQYFVRCHRQDSRYPRARHQQFVVQRLETFKASTIVIEDIDMEQPAARHLRIQPQSQSSNVDNIGGTDGKTRPRVVPETKEVERTVPGKTSQKVTPQLAIQIAKLMAELTHGGSSRTMAMNLVRSALKDASRGVMPDASGIVQLVESVPFMLEGASASEHSELLSIVESGVNRNIGNFATKGLIVRLIVGLARVPCCPSSMTQLLQRALEFTSAFTMEDLASVLCAVHVLKFRGNVAALACLASRFTDLVCSGASNSGLSAPCIDRNDSIPVARHLPQLLAALTHWSRERLLPCNDLRVWAIKTLASSWPQVFPSDVDLSSDAFDDILLVLESIVQRAAVLPISAQDEADTTTLLLLKACGSINDGITETAMRFRGQQKLSTQLAEGGVNEDHCWRLLRLLADPDGHLRRLAPSTAQQLDSNCALLLCNYMLPGAPLNYVVAILAAAVSGIPLSQSNKEGTLRLPDRPSSAVFHAIARTALSRVVGLIIGSSVDHAGAATPVAINKHALKVLCGHNTELVVDLVAAVWRLLFCAAPPTHQSDQKRSATTTLKRSKKKDKKKLNRGLSSTDAAVVSDHALGTLTIHQSIELQTPGDTGSTTTTTTKKESQRRTAGKSVEGSSWGTAAGFIVEPVQASHIVSLFNAAAMHLNERVQHLMEVTDRVDGAEVPSVVNPTIGDGATTTTAAVAEMQILVHRLSANGGVAKGSRPVVGRVASPILELKGINSGRLNVDDPAAPRTLLETVDALHPVTSASGTAETSDAL